MNTIDTQQHVHSFVDQLPPTQLAVIEELLSVMLDPVGHALRNAPIEDEELGEEEERSATCAKQWFQHNGGTSLQELAAELGFSMEEIRQSKELA